jgi:NTP pyrophosphatase (non-canonical NTP hydrolase)
MTFDEYQKKAITTDTYKGKMNSVTDHSFLEKAFGLVGEAGEVAEKMKKIIRDKDGIMNEEDKIEIQKEFGDVLWYISSCSYYLGISLEDVAKMNIDKVLSRKQRGTTKGSGDNR